MTWKKLTEGDCREWKVSENTVVLVEIYLSLHTAICPQGHSRQVCAASVSIRQKKGRK